MHNNSFSILITGSVLDSQAHPSALRFVTQALQQGKTIESIFFYAQGVSVASSLLLPMSDELNPTRAWQGLQDKFSLELNVCIASAERRGIIGVESAEEHRLDGHNLAEGFRVVGLAQLHAAMLTTTHLVRFT